MANDNFLHAPSFHKDIFSLWEEVAAKKINRKRD